MPKLYIVKAPGKFYGALTEAVVRAEDENEAASILRDSWPSPHYNIPIEVEEIPLEGPHEIVSGTEDW